MALKPYTGPSFLKKKSGPLFSGECKNAIIESLEGFFLNSLPYKCLHFVHYDWNLKNPNQCSHLESLCIIFPSLGNVLILFAKEAYFMLFSRPWPLLTFRRRKEGAHEWPQQPTSGSLTDSALTFPPQIIKRLQFSLPQAEDPNLPHPTCHNPHSTDQTSFLCLFLPKPALCFPVVLCLTSWLELSFHVIQEHSHQCFSSTNVRSEPVAWVRLTTFWSLLYNSPCQGRKHKMADLVNFIQHKPKGQDTRIVCRSTRPMRHEL